MEGGVSKIVQIVWRHLWTIPNTNLVDEDVTLFQISFFLLLTTKWNHILLRNYWRHQFWLIHWTSKKKCHMFRFDNPKFFVLSSPLMTPHSQEVNIVLLNSIKEDFQLKHCSSFVLDTFFKKNISLLNACSFGNLKVALTCKFRLQKRRKV